MTYTIRPFQKDDLDDLLTAWERASRQAHPFLPESFFKKERDNIPKLYIPNTDTWVITLEDKVVGFVSLLIDPSQATNHCEIGGLFIEPAYHGQGMGQALVDKAHSLFNNITVKVFKDNKQGRRFYDKYGFHQINELVWEETGDRLLELKLSKA